MQEQNIMSHTKGHHLIAFERGKIAALHGEEKSNREIARILGICRQNVANELNRGQIDQVQKINGKRVYRTEYSAETARKQKITARIP